MSEKYKCKSCEGCDDFEVPLFEADGKMLCGACASNRLSFKLYRARDKLVEKNKIIAELSRYNNYLQESNKKYLDTIEEVHDEIKWMQNEMYNRKI